MNFIDAIQAVVIVVVSMSFWHRVVNSERPWCIQVQNRLFDFGTWMIERYQQAREEAER